MASNFGTYTGTYRTTQTTTYSTYVQAKNLPAHYPHIITNPPNVIQGAKEKILQDFVFAVNQHFSSSVGNNILKEFSIEELNSLLEMWTTQKAGSQLGQGLGNGIAQKLGNEAWTGAGLLKGLSEGLVIDNVTDGRTKLAKKALDEADTLWQKIDKLLQAYIDKYAALKEDALLAKCLDVYKSTGKANSKFLAKYNGIQLTPAQERSLSPKVIGEFNALEQSLNNLMSLVNAKGAGGKIGLKENPYALGESIGGNFSALGGETIGEIVGLTSAQQIKQVEKKVEKEINNLFETNGGKVIIDAFQTGEDTIDIGGESKQAKGDWFISMTIGNVTISIPVSQKMHGFQRKTGYYWDKAHRYQAAQTLNLQTLMAMTFTGSPEWIEQHLAVLSSSEEDNIDIKNNATELNQAVRLWNDFKEAARYIGLFRALVGTGTKTSGGNVDFAALLVVNNKIVSIGEILYKLVKENNNSVFRMTPNNIIDFIQMREQVSGSYYSEKNIFDIHKKDGGKKTRISEQYAAIRKLYLEQKYKFEINMQLLGATK